MSRIEALEGLDLVVRLGREWFPVMHEDVAFDSYADLITDATRVLRAVGLGSLLAWQAVAGHIEAGSTHGTAGHLPPAVNGSPWGVAIMAGSVVLLAERDGASVNRTAIGARLVPTQPGPSSIVEIDHALTPARRIVVTGRPDHGLERLVIENEAIAEGPAANQVDGPPREVILVGRSIGLAWDVPGLPVPHVIWTAKAWARDALPAEQRADVAAILGHAVHALGAADGRRAVRDRRAGDPPPLNYSALLDPGEHVTATMIVNP